MFLKLDITILLTALLVGNINAGVVRIDEANSKVAIQKAEFIESTTAAAATTVKTTILTAVPNEFERKEDNATAVKDPPRAVTRDEDATIEIDATTLDPTTEGVDLVVDLEILQADENRGHTGESSVKKSAALLLLNVPANEKPKQLEENIEEPEELTEEGSTQETTTTDSVTTVGTTTEIHNEDTTTPLPNTNVTVSSGLEKKSDDNAVTVDALQESSPVAPSDNVGATLLIADSGEDFVVFDSDFEQLGSFTHIDSDEHLQPIVQSVEIVPTSVDDSLIVNYVHSW